MKTPLPARPIFAATKDAAPTMDDWTERVVKPALEKRGLPTEPASGANPLVGVRMQPELLKRLDAYRGGSTRPQAIREILEKHL